MYDGYYNFTQKPFQLTADPEFFYNSVIHKRAIAYMRYGLTQGEGFVVITGMPGLGKTMLVKELVKTLSDEKIVYGVMVSSQVGPIETLKIVSSTFGLPYEGDDKALLLAGIEKFIKISAEKEQRILLIVDEAQNMPKESLEELRMISNFEMYGKIVFQTFLIGQKQLRSKIFAPDMEQLKQRIVSTFQLEPLNEEETQQYILYRLEKAGWQENPKFEEEAYIKIHQYSFGVPRKINTLCDRILLFGYLDRLDTITAESVKKVIDELEREMFDSQELQAELVQPNFQSAYSPQPQQQAVIQGNNAVYSSGLNIDAAQPYEERLSKLEKKVESLEQMLNREKALLRKAIFIQLDMEDVYADKDSPE